jgi:hypothetical protein
MASSVYNKQFVLDRYSWYKIVIVLKEETSGLIKIFNKENTNQLVPTIKFPNNLFLTKEFEYAFPLQILNETVINIYGLGIIVQDMNITRIERPEVDKIINFNRLQQVGDLEFTVHYLKLLGKVGGSYDKLLDKYKLLKDSDYYLHRATNKKDLPPSKRENVLILLNDTFQYENSMEAIKWHNICKLLNLRSGNKQFYILGKYGYPYTRGVKIYGKKVNSVIDGINYVKGVGNVSSEDIPLSEYIIKYAEELSNIYSKYNIGLIVAYDLLNGFAAMTAGLPYIYEPGVNAIKLEGDKGLLNTKIETDVRKSATTVIIRKQISGLNDNKFYIPYSVDDLWLSRYSDSKSTKLRIGYIGVDTENNIGNILELIKIIGNQPYTLIIVLDEIILSRQLDNYKKNGSIIVTVCKDYDTLPKYCRNIDVFVFMKNYSFYNIVNAMGMKKPIICSTEVDFDGLYKYKEVGEICNLIKGASKNVEYNIVSDNGLTNTYDELIKI